MLSNITSINLDLQTQGSALVAKQIKALVSPSRRLYVFGGASNLFPYFDSFGSAKTYADALSPAPSTTHPVSIVLLSKQNGDPEPITGNSDWYALCLAGIYVSSPYREIFSTTTLPTTLPKGMRVMYEDANGTESLWVGNASGNAWPAVGYKEYVAIVDYNDATSSISAVVKKNTITSSVPVVALVGANGFSVAIPSVAVTNTVVAYGYGEPTDSINTVYTRVTTGLVTTSADAASHGEVNAQITIKIFP